MEKSKNPTGVRLSAGTVFLLSLAAAFASHAAQPYERRDGLENTRANLKADRTGYQWLSFAAYADSWWRKGTLTDYPGQIEKEIKSAFGGHPRCNRTGYSKDLWWAQYRPGGRVSSTHTVCWDSNILKDAVKSDPETAARQFEVIVRQARAYNPFQSWFVVHGDDPAVVAEYKAGRAPKTVEIAERVAAHYGLPTLNLAKAAAEGGSEAAKAAVSAFVKDVLSAGNPPAKAPACRKIPSLARELNAQCHVVTYDDGSIRKPGAWKIGVKSPNPNYMSAIAAGAAGDRMEMEFRGTEVGLLDFSLAGGAEYAARVDGGEWKAIPAADGTKRVERHIRIAERLAYSGQVSAGASDADRHTLELKVTKPGAGAIVGFILNGSTADEDAGAGRPPQTLADLDREYAKIKPVKYVPPAGRHRLLPRTMKRLNEGPTLNIVCLGDSLIADTCKSHFELLLSRRYPKCRVTSVCSARSSTGCWWYKDENRVDGWVFSHKPDLLVIGGVSQRDDVEAMRSVIRQCKAKKPDLEILVMTPVFGQEEQAGWNVGFDENPDKAAHPFRRQVRDMCAEEKVAFFDITAPLRRYVMDSGMDMGYYHRDGVHSNVRGQTLVGRLIDAWFAPSAAASVTKSASLPELLVTDDGSKGMNLTAVNRLRARQQSVVAGRAQIDRAWYASREELDFFRLEYGKPCGEMDFAVPEGKNATWSHLWGYSKQTGDAGIRFGRGWERYRMCRWAIEMDIEQNVEASDWRLFCNTTLNNRKAHDFKVKGRGRQTFAKDLDMIRLLVGNTQVSGLDLVCLTPGAKGKIRSLRLVPRVAYMTWKRVLDFGETPVRVGLSMSSWNDFTLAVNGTEVDRGMIMTSPGYARYELGGLVKKGRNEITVRAEVGGGWNPSTRLVAELFAVYRDGRTVRYDADENWLWSHDGETWKKGKVEKQPVRAVPLHAGALDPKPVEKNGYPVFDYDREIAWRFSLPGAIAKPRLAWRVEDALKGGTVEEGETAEELVAADGAATVVKKVVLKTHRTGAYRVWWTLFSDGKEIDRHDTEMIVAGPLDQTVVPLKDFEKTLVARLRKVQDVDCTKEESDPTRFLDHAGKHSKPALNVGKVVEEGGLRARQTGPGNLDYFAYKLDVEHLGLPHILEIDYPETHEFTLCCWINESYPIGFCNNMPPAGSRSWPQATGSVKVGGYLPLSGGKGKMRIVFFPGSKNITACFENGGVAGPAAVCGFRLYEVPEGLPALEIPKDTPRRYMNHHEQQLFSPWGCSVTPLIRYQYVGLVEDGWIAAYAAAANRTAFLRYAGHNAADEGVYMYQQGFPTRSGESCSVHDEYDFRYPMLKMYRHNGIHTTLAFEYLRSPVFERNGALSVSDREIQAGTKRTIYNVTRDGRQAVGYMGQGMNFLNAEVRASMRRLLGEIYDRYADVADVEQLLVVCGGWWMPGMTQFPGYGLHELGYDDDSVGMFERETGIRLGTGTAGAERFTKRFNLLTGQYRKEWFAWRAKKMQEVLRELRAVVSRGERKWEIVAKAGYGGPKDLPGSSGYSPADFGEGSGNPIRSLASMCFGRECYFEDYGTMFNPESAASRWRLDAAFYGCGPLNEHWNDCRAAKKWWWRNNGVDVYDVKPSGPCAYWDVVTSCADYALQTIVHSWIDVNCTTAHGEECRRFLDAFYRIPLDRHPEPLKGVTGINAKRYGDRALLVNPTPWGVEGTLGGKEVKIGPYGMLVCDADVTGSFRMAPGCPHADFAAAVKAMTYESMLAVRNAEALKGNLVSQRRLEKQLAKNGVARIDAGRMKWDVTDEKGNRWLCDQKWVPGRAYGSEKVIPVDRGKVEIGGTEIPTIYRTEAGARDDHTYHIPVPAGRYDVVLHYAETWDTLPGQRLMEVSVNGVSRKVDVWKLSGGRMRACQVKFEDVVVPENGEILYRSKDRAIVNGIEIFVRRTE